VHRTIRLALNEAVRRGHMSKNPALLAKAPASDEQEIEPYNVDDIKRILKVAGERRNGVRWVIALALVSVKERRLDSSGLTST
jgi:integrase